MLWWWAAAFLTLELQSWWLRTFLVTDGDDNRQKYRATRNLKMAWVYTTSTIEKVWQVHPPGVREWWRSPLLRIWAEQARRGIGVRSLNILIICWWEFRAMLRWQSEERHFDLWGKVVKGTLGNRYEQRQELRVGPYLKQWCRYLNAKPVLSMITPVFLIHSDPLAPT